MTAHRSMLTIGRATDAWHLVTDEAPLLATGMRTEAGKAPFLSFVLAAPPSASPAWQAWTRLPGLIMQAYHEDRPIVLRILFPDDRPALDLHGMVVEVRTTGSPATLINAQGEDLVPPTDDLSTIGTMAYLLTEAHGVRGGLPHTWGLTLKLDRTYRKTLAAVLS